MKKIYSLLTLALFAVIVSCTDDELDPLQFKKVSKGTLLALRGDFLQAIYNDGVNGAEFVPLITDGTDVFTFDAEYLADDPSSLASIDVYVEKKSGERVLLKNVPGSAFKQTDDYIRPWATVSTTLTEVMSKLGLPTDFPMSQATVDILLDDYGAGIAIVTDLNLVDGTKVLADEMVAAGLYQSDQFYPAHRLPWTPIKYCPYEEGNWAGDYKSLEIGAEDTKGPYITTMTQTGPDTYTLSHVLDSRDNPLTLLVVEPTYEVELEFTPSTSPYDQEITVTTATFGTGDTAQEFKATGSYEQCHVLNDDGSSKDEGTIFLTVTYGKVGSKTPYKFTYQLKKIVD